MNLNDLDRLLIEAECTRVVNQYANLIDFCRYDEFADLFAVHCYFHVTGDPLTSREQIRDRVYNRPKEQLLRHVTTNIVIDVLDERSASGIAYFTVYRASTSEGPSEVLNFRPASVGHYKDKFVKTTEGWKFAERIGHFDMIDLEHYSS